MMTRSVYYLAVLSIFFVLVILGIWQLNRAAYKSLLQLQWLARSTITLTADDLNYRSHDDLNYYQARLEGKFDNTHTFLIDNKIVHHQLGYYVITPFAIFGSNQWILVNRGWIPRNEAHAIPFIDPVLGQQTITGRLVPFTRHLQLRDDQFTGQWPWIVQQISLQQVAQLLKTSFYPYQLQLNNAIVAIPNLSAQKHIAYALQWFTLAAVFLLACGIVWAKNRKN